MSDDVVKQIQELSIGDHAENEAWTPPAAQVHAVAGLDFALASLRELIGRRMHSRFTFARMAAQFSVCLCICASSAEAIPFTHGDPCTSDRYSCRLAPAVC